MELVITHCADDNSLTVILSVLIDAPDNPMTVEHKIPVKQLISPETIEGEALAASSLLLVKLGHKLKNELLEATRQGVSQYLPMAVATIAARSGGEGSPGASGGGAGT